MVKSTTSASLSFSMSANPCRDSSPPIFTIRSPTRIASSGCSAFHFATTPPSGSSVTTSAGELSLKSSCTPSCCPVLSMTTGLSRGRVICRVKVSFILKSISWRSVALPVMPFTDLMRSKRFTSRPGVLMLCSLNTPSLRICVIVGPLSSMRSSSMPNCTFGLTSISTSKSPSGMGAHGICTVLSDRPLTSSQITVARVSTSATLSSSGPRQHVQNMRETAQGPSTVDFAVLS
mmetsp:Transcript_7131/g.14811  ORF Transcript_7131/g.14811 Transcript_7131/m.14811 type:complete len:233 (-) Transcript_7131:10-708(-)